MLINLNLNLKPSLETDSDRISSKINCQFKLVKLVFISTSDTGQYYQAIANILEVTEENNINHNTKIYYRQQALKVYNWEVQYLWLQAQVWATVIWHLNACHIPEQESSNTGHHTTTQNTHYSCLLTYTNNNDTCSPDGPQNMWLSLQFLHCVHLLQSLEMDIQPFDFWTYCC